MNNPRIRREKSAQKKSREPQKSAFDRACSALGRRRLTEAEVRQRLSRLYPADEIEQTIEKLQGYRFLDDEALIEDYTRDRLRHSPRSAAMIETELVRRGIDSDHFQRIFQEKFPDYEELEIAGRALSQHFRSRPTSQKEKSSAQGCREKVLRFLHSRGFSYEVMLEAWERYRLNEKSLLDDQYSEDAV